MFGFVVSSTTNDATFVEFKWGNLLVNRSASSARVVIP